MMTDDRQPHPFMLEDIQLRCEMAAESWEQALVRLPSLIATLQDQRDQKMFQDVAGDLEQLKRVAKSYALHLRETNVAMLLRQDLEAGRPMMQKLENELGELLAADAENQRNHGRIVQMRNAYAENPEAFVRTHLIPVEQTVLEKGYHTLTTR
jgi:DNA mismatch repair ATPase MutL